MATALIPCTSPRAAANGDAATVLGQSSWMALPSPDASPVMGTSLPNNMRKRGDLDATPLRRTPLATQTLHQRISRWMD